MDIPRFPAPECFRKDEKKTRNISNRVSVWVNFSMKNHKENEYFFSSRFARLAVSILSNSHDEFTEERSDPRTQGIQSTQTQGINLCSFLRRTLNFASRGQRNNRTRETSSPRSEATPGRIASNGRSSVLSFFPAFFIPHDMLFCCLVLIRSVF